MDKATKGGKRERRKSSILEGIIVDGGIALAVQPEVAAIVQRRKSMTATTSKVAPLPAAAIVPRRKSIAAATAKIAPLPLDLPSRMSWK